MQPRNCPLLLPWPVTFKKNGHQIRNGDRAPISGHAANSVFRFDRRLNYVATPMPPDWIANQPENSMIDFFQRSLRLPSFFFFLSFFLHFVSRRGWAIADYRRFKAETRVDLCGKQVYIYIYKTILVSWFTRLEIDIGGIWNLLCGLIACHIYSVFYRVKLVSWNIRKFNLGRGILEVRSLISL